MHTSGRYRRADDRLSGSTQRHDSRNPDTPDTPSGDGRDPDTGHSDGGHPDESHSDGRDPDTEHSDTEHSDGGHPGESHSDGRDPDKGHSDTGHSDGGHPDESHSDGRDPDKGHSDTGHSDGGHPDESHSDGRDPGTGHSDGGHLLDLAGVDVFYGRHRVLHDITFSLPKATLLAVVGPNGAGKSTLLEAILGIIPHQNGHISLFGTSPRDVLDRVAYVPQRAKVNWNFPADSADIVTMGLHRKIGRFWPVRAKHRRLAIRYLDRVGLASYADHPIGRLSGGQQQRVMIARALAQQADIYFMDEPFAAIDAKSEECLADLFARLHDAGKTVICVHHDLATLRRYFGHVLFLNRRIVAFGPTDAVCRGETIEHTYTDPPDDGDRGPKDRIDV